MTVDPSDIAFALEVASSYRVGSDLPGRLEHALLWQEKQAMVMAEAAGVIRKLLGEFSRQAIQLSALQAEVQMWRNGVRPSQEVVNAATRGH
jgi:hypothetical protein